MWRGGGGSLCDRMASSCRYKLVLGKARKFELEQHRVVLCTCSCAASRSLKKLAVRQILIDEAGMATEPETLIPLVTFSQAEKVSSWAVRARPVSLGGQRRGGGAGRSRSVGVGTVPACPSRWFFLGTTSSCGLWSRMSSCKIWGWTGLSSRGTTWTPTCWTHSTAW